MNFTCEACGRVVAHDVAENLQAMPQGWRMHEIKGKRYLLCSGCGGPGAFYGGLSPRLKQKLSARHGVEFGDDD